MGKSSSKSNVITKVNTQSITASQNLPFCKSGNHFYLTGHIIGTNNEVDAHLNCDFCWEKGMKGSEKDTAGNTKVELTPGTRKEFWTGFKYQNVEYARRWMITNQKCTFADVNWACNIFDIEYVEDLLTGDKKPFKSFLNTSQTPPIYGDYIIFPRGYLQRFGHVAVITGINIDQGYVEICEQSFNNVWEEPTSYSRKLVLLKYEGLYTLTEVKWKEGSNDYINSNELGKEIVKIETIRVLGWKRICN